LDEASNAIIVNLPTSSGKTLIAEYRALKALNQFSERGGWVAYIVPTRALVNQISFRLKADLSPIGVKVEKLSGALELDGFEEAILEQDIVARNTEDSDSRSFDILVTTYEKLQLLVRQGLGTDEDTATGFDYS
jgi:replicative superfamily II helicase